MTAPIIPTLEGKDISTEVWREYEFGGKVYRINSPKLLYWRQGGTTHRVVDSDGIVHCVPAPGNNGCVLRWFCGEGKPPIQF